MNDQELQAAIDRIDAGEDAFRDDDEIVTLTVRQPLDRVIPVRMSGDRWSALYREARELGVGPTTLARMWIMEKLRAVEAGRSGARRVGEERAEYAAGPAKTRGASKRSGSKNSGAPKKQITAKKGRAAETSAKATASRKGRVGK